MFDPPITYSGVDWGMDEAVERLIDEGYVPGMIVVGIWNTPLRELEYMPLKPLFKPGFRAFLRRSTLRELPISDAYLKFIVDEVKPFIDSHYRTLPDQAHTFVMGSSMGGLISAYALSEYPHIFGGAGCISTHLMAAGSLLVDYFGEALPKAGSHKLYFDYGTLGVDAPYEYYQKKLDQYLVRLGYRFGEDWITQKFVGGDHSERSWRTRVHIPLKLFLSQGRPAGNPT